MQVELKGKLYDTGEYTNKAGQYGASGRLVKASEGKTLQMSTKDKTLGSRMIAFEVQDVSVKVEMGTGNWGTDVVLMEIEQNGKKV